MMTDFNPIFETCGGIKMSLTEICHSAGMTARTTGYKGKCREDAYYAAYYDALRDLMPDHPILAGHAIT
jgi:hypothetical protein